MYAATSNRQQDKRFGFDAFQQISFDGKRLRFAGSAGGIRINKDRPLLSNAPQKSL
jgi:hypothetical protein